MRCFCPCLGVLFGLRDEPTSHFVGRLHSRIANFLLVNLLCCCTVVCATDEQAVLLLDWGSDQQAKLQLRWPVWSIFCFFAFSSTTAAFFMLLLWSLLALSHVHFPQSSLEDNWFLLVWKAIVWMRLFGRKLFNLLNDFCSEVAARKPSPSYLKRKCPNVWGANVWVSNMCFATVWQNQKLLRFLCF